MILGFISYLAASFAFMVLTLLMVAGWKGRIQGGMLIVASMISFVWATVFTIQAAYGPFFSANTLFIVEILRDGAWIYFLLRLIGGPRGKAAPPVLSLSAKYLPVGILVVGLIAGMMPQAGILVSDVTAVLRPGALLLSLLGLVLVEQLYRNTAPEKRWAVKFLCIGVGGFFAYDLFLYSHAMLFKQIEATLFISRGVVNAVLVPLIVLAARRNPEWSLDVFVSRQIVFYTTSLFGAGVYLMSMALVGYWIKIFGGNWGALAQVIFLSGAGLILVMVLFSDKARRALRVFLSKHFYRNKYDYREEWLRLIEILSKSDDAMALPDRSITALARMVDANGGVLWLKHGEPEAYAPLAAVNVAMPGDAVVQPEASLVKFLDRTHWVIDTDEYRDDPNIYEGLDLPVWLQDRHERILVVPLIHSSSLLGFVALEKMPLSFTLTYEDTDLLKTVGRQVASYLAQSLGDQALSESRQFDAYNKFTAFIMHDLKNLIAQQSLVVRNAARHKKNPEFVEDAIQTISNSVERMNSLLKQLKRRDPQPQGQKIRVHAMLVETISKCSALQPHPVLVDGAENDAANDVVVFAEAEPLAMVLTHIIRNAQDATPDDGSVAVSLNCEDEEAVIKVTDSGSGMDAEFVRERLFKPFDSTKGSKGMGIGAYQVRQFVTDNGGSIDVSSTPGEGTSFTIRLPLHKTTEATA